MTAWGGGGEAAHQRIGAPHDVALRPGAIDDAPHGHSLRDIGVARAPDERVALDRDNLAGDERQATFHPQRDDLPGESGGIQLERDVDRGQPVLSYEGAKKIGSRRGADDAEQ